jgi:hypothetical protein
VSTKALKEWIKFFQIAGKGHDVILEIANSLKHTKDLTVKLEGHVPENGGTWSSHLLHVISDKAVQSLKKYFLLQNMEKLYFSLWIQSNRSETTFYCKILESETFCPHCRDVFGVLHTKSCWRPDRPTDSCSNKQTDFDWNTANYFYFMTVMLTDRYYIIISGTQSTKWSAWTINLIIQYYNHIKLNLSCCCNTRNQTSTFQGSIDLKIRIQYRNNNGDQDQN